MERDWKMAVSDIQTRILRTLKGSRAMTEVSLIVEGFLPPDSTAAALSGLAEHGFVNARRRGGLDEPLYTLTAQGEQAIRLG